MKGPHHLVFAMSSSRTDDSIAEEVQNALDEYLEDEWEVVSWRRSSGTRFIVRATVEARAICSDEPLKIRMMTMSHLLEEMTEPNAEWLIPKKSKIGTPGEMAERMVTKWLNALWPEEDGDKPDKPEAKPEEAGEAGETAEQEVAPQKPAVQSFVKKSPGEEVLEAFGLMGGETDSEGAPLGVFTLKKKA